MNHMRITIAILMVILIQPAFPQDGPSLTQLSQWKKMAEQGGAIAQLNLGFMYFRGHGVPKDFVLSYMWFNLAASQLAGDERKMIVKARDAAEKVLTREQINKAQRLAREWKPN